MVHQRLGFPGAFRHPELVALMVTQTVGWGSSQALIGALATPIASDMNLSHTLVYAGATVMFLTGALCAPHAGRLADRFGGGINLAAGSLVFVISLVLLSHASGAISYLLAWVVFGIGMHLALATSAMALLAGVSGGATRRNVSILSLAMGLSSSIAWPIASWLDAHLGWRMTCLCFAGANLILAFPLHLAIALKTRASSQLGALDRPRRPASLSGAEADKAFVLLAFGVTLMAVVAITISVMLIDILDGLGLSRAEAVAAASTLGFAYLTGRLVDLYLSRYFDPLVQGVLSYVAVLAAIALIFAWSWLDRPLPFPMAVVFVFAYGIPAGLNVILRATLVLHIFGSSGYGHRTGRLYNFADLANALTPLVAAPLLALGTSLLTGALLLPATAAATAMALLIRRLTSKATPDFED